MRHLGDNVLRSNGERRKWKIENGSRKLFIKRLFTLTIVYCLCTVFAVSANAATSITPGALSVQSTLEAISVTAPFTGDDNANSSAIIQFRKTGSGTWLNAYPPFIDHRATLGGAANPYANQARGSIVGLAPNTNYDVQVIWTDADGVSGQPVPVTLMTLTSSPPTGDSVITVTNNSTLSSALSSVNPGQTIHLAAGTYSPFTISQSGNSGAWIVVEGEAGTIVSGTGVNQNIAVNANFVIVRNLTLSDSDFNGITIGSGHNNVIIQNNTLQNISARCADGPTTTHYGDTGIDVGSGSSNILILGNTVNSTSLDACIQSVPFDGPGTGIGLTGCTSCVFDRNTITGGFRDALSSDDSNDATANIDMSRNNVTGYVDDGIECKGNNLNARLWSNIINSSQADTCMAGNTNTATNQYGPLYIFRNVCHITGTLQSGGGEIFKITPAAPTYLFHNSMDASAGGTGWAAFEMAGGGDGPFVVMNNAIKTSASMSEHAPAGTIFDYDIGTDGSSLAYKWNDQTDYATFATFRTGTGQEAHGYNADPLFADALEHLQAASTAIDKGVVLPNFNDSTSAWPYAGSAPDIGAYETGGSSSASACDLNGDGSTNVSDVQLCVNQAIGVTACTTGDINKDGVCNVIDVQRDVNAALGGTCVTQ